MTSSYTPYKAKMRVYGHISVNEQDGNLYSNPIHSAPYSVSFPSLHKKCSSDTVLSENFTDDYAEPQINLNQLNSASLSDNIYSQAYPKAIDNVTPVPSQSIRNPDYSNIEIETDSNVEFPRDIFYIENKYCSVSMCITSEIKQDSVKNQRNNI